MGGNPVVAAVDWGTTHLRIWLLDGAGRPTAERRTDDGLSAARAAGFPQTLERHLTALGAPPGLPAVVCGMAGSRQGWIEAPYVQVPAPLAAALSHPVRVPGIERDVRIVPGLSQNLAEAPDLMRGEETQLAGARLAGRRRHLVCMPGTHSKWVTIDDGVVTTFATWPTGELFWLLASHSILRHSIGGEPAGGGPAFDDACASALREGGDIAPRLFPIRAAGLLHGLPAAEAAARLSGTLIGGEIASARRRWEPGGDGVTLIASGSLGTLYHRALRLAGIAVAPVDADRAVREGLMLAAHCFGEGQGETP